MRWLYLVAFAVIYSNVSGQEKEVVFSNSGTTTNVSKADVNDPAKRELDSLQTSMRKNNAIDSLGKLQQTVTGQNVYSQKQWRKFYDSLNKSPLANVPSIDQLPKKETTEAELIESLNQKFYGADSSRLTQSERFPGNPDNLLKETASSEVPYGKDLPDASDLKLPDEDLKDLTPLRASTIKTKYTSKFDSLRSIHLKNEELKLTEKEISEDQIVSEISPKPKFWDKTYFEGVVGFTPGDFKILQAAPTMGYHFTQYLSLGLGPNVLIQQNDKKVVTTVGLKTFFKAEFLKRQGYFQVEDIMDSYGQVGTKEETKKFYQQHNVFAGGGFLLNINAPVTLNFSVLYCITENKVVNHEFSPMVFRIGLSSVKVKK
ncbi:MAG TPA: hypothetical protein VGK59_03500 [Ohtaekwangia sp.]